MNHTGGFLINPLARMQDYQIRLPNKYLLTADGRSTFELARIHRQALLGSERRVSRTQI